MAYAMGKAASLLLLFSFFFLLQCFTNINASSSITNGSAELAATISSGEGPWCIAKGAATSEELQANIQYSCGGGIANCDALQMGGPCYFPNNVYRHASYAMNAYYYAAGPAAINCDFKGTGRLVVNDPSYKNCAYPS